MKRRTTWSGVYLDALRRLLTGLLVALLVILYPCEGGLQPAPAWGASIAQVGSGINTEASTQQRTVLTAELLQERMRSPVATEGIRTLDLRRFVIDLRPENGTFRDKFYRSLQAQLQSSGGPLRLDLSYSLIQGDLAGRQLGLRAPLFGQALSPIFTPAEQAQLKRDRRRLTQLRQLSRSLLADDLAPRELQLTVLRGPLRLVQTRFDGRVDFSNTFFLNQVEAQGAEFNQEVDWSQARFSQPISFAGATFAQTAAFRSSIFFSKANFNQSRFIKSVNFQASEFQATANFYRSLFQQSANFSRVEWEGNVDFAQARWQDRALFAKATFSQGLFLTDATFEKLVTFREAQFNRLVNLRGASILDQADLSDVGFAKSAYLNIPGLRFDPNQARILGNPGQIGQFLSVPTLQGNESLLRNLVRNFRQLEQIGDANQIEYAMQKLQLAQLRQQLFSTNINTASVPRLIAVGFSPKQAEAIAQTRSKQSFRRLTDLLTQEAVDLATYINTKDRAIAGDPLSFPGWLLTALYWLGLSLLLLLSQYGTSFWLIFGIGLLAVAYFGLLFWLVDRWRRLRPTPIIPSLNETIWVLSCFSLLVLGGLIAVFRTAETPWLTLAFLSALTVPLPAGILWIIYQRGRYHDLMDVSYFVEDGGLRQLRLLIGRIPVMPRFQFYRDRYQPILWKRRWGWLNYYDLSINNWLKFGFNDIRLRDEHLPGLISSLVWYQWGLGVLYIALLLWTLSRTIPGLNLFIYF